MGVVQPAHRGYNTQKSKRPHVAWATQGASIKHRLNTIVPHLQQEDERPVEERHGIVWEEWKQADAMPALAARMPNRYTQDADGTWRCPPGEAAVAAFGGSYRVRTSAEINWTVQRNLRFLEDYLRSDCPTIPDELTATIQTHLSHSGGTTLATLRAILPANAVDALYTLIATEQIALDLAAAPLAEPERVVLLPDDAPRAASEPHPTGG
jgi:hypothetical protein